MTLASSPALGKPNGCFNRQPRPGYVAQDGWVDEPFANPPLRMPRYVMITNRMSVDCKYQEATPTDPKCEGCKWKSK